MKTWLIIQIVSNKECKSFYGTFSSLEQEINCGKRLKAGEEDLSCTFENCPIRSDVRSNDK